MNEVDPVPIADALDAVARDLHGAQTSTISTIVARWSDIVGPELAAVAAPGSLSDGVLTVVVSDPAASTALRRDAGAIAARLAALCGPGVVRQVRARVRRR